MDSNKRIGSPLGESVFILFAIGVLALILITVISFLLDPQSAEGAQKLWMTNPPGTWYCMNSWVFNPFTFEWVPGSWWLFFMYF